MSDRLASRPSSAEDSAAAIAVRGPSSRRGAACTTGGHGTGCDSSRELAELGERVQGILDRDEALSVGDLAVGGREVMDHLGLTPGPAVGRVLGALLDRVLDDPALNTREQLLELAEEIYPEG